MGIRWYMAYTRVYPQYTHGQRYRLNSFFSASSVHELGVVWLDSEMSDIYRRRQRWERGGTEEGGLFGIGLLG